MSPGGGLRKFGVGERWGALVTGPLWHGIRRREPYPARRGLYSLHSCRLRENSTHLLGDVQRTYLPLHLFTNCIHELIVDISILSILKENMLMGMLRVVELSVFKKLALKAS